MISEPPKEKILISHGVEEKIPTVFVTDSPQQDTEGEQKKHIKPSFGRHALHLGMDFLETIVVALSIFVVVYLFLVQPHEVKGTSMEPTFHNNEYILTDKISYTFVNPERGDVIIFKSPSNPEVDYIKRVIGLPGDTVMIEQGDVYVNGKKIPEPYIADRTYLTPGNMVREGVPVTVPEGQYFAMGDNRPHSSDSREFGPITRGSIVGRAFFRYWPFNVLGVVEHFSYDEKDPDRSSSETQ